MPRWIQEQPRSAEAQFYRGWLATIDKQPGEIAASIEEATRLGLDEDHLIPLTGIYEARIGKIKEAEPILRLAYDAGQEPRALVARELAGSTWRPIGCPRPARRSSDGGRRRPRIPSPICGPTRSPPGPIASPRS